LAQFIVVGDEVHESLRLLHSRIPGAEAPPPAEPHALVASLLKHCVALCAAGSPISTELRDTLARHVAYHRPIIALHSWTDLDQAGDGFRVKSPKEQSADAVRQCVAELLGHLATGFNVALDLIGTPDLTQFDVANPLFDLVPRSVFSLRTEAELNLIAPWFMRTLQVPGDVCEFGCFRGTMAIKFAFALKALAIEKTVYAFDTFEGFTSNDPADGQVGVGFYKVDEDTFEELRRWSKAIPVHPIKGDAAETCKILNGPLSFVWLDLDHGSLMRPVFETIWPLLSSRTIIGIDDIGRLDGARNQVTPGVEIWVNELVGARRLIELKRYPSYFIRFYRANK
jgi:hypothetical protein